MKKQAEVVRNRRRAAALAAATALVAVFAAGCDSRVNVQGPRFALPTVPPIPSSPAGASVSELRPIAGVAGVSLDAVGHVRIALGASESLLITAPEELMPLLTSVVVGGRLILDRDSESYQGQASDIQYEIGLVRLDELILNGVGEVDAEGVDSADFRVEHRGVGGIRAAGRADRQEVVLAGVGDYIAPGLESRVTRVDIASGHAVVWATERIEGWIGAGCRLEFWGDAEVAVHGSGVVKRLGPAP